MLPEIIVRLYGFEFEAMPVESCYLSIKNPGIPAKGNNDSIT
jgi:hypothetical protein